MTTTATSYLQATSLVPSLTVDDLQQSITFYEKLGFVIEERWEDGGVATGSDAAGGRVPHRPHPG